MRTFLIVIAVLIGAVADAAPIQEADLKKAGFTKSFKRMKPAEKETFAKAYPQDEEMIDRMNADGIRVSYCLAGEAPTLEAANKKSPGFYPKLGRMKGVDGSFEWIDKKLHFRTVTQFYHVDEYHLLHRLEKLGLQRKDGARKATVSAVWLLNSIGGIRFVYMQDIALK